MGRGGEAEWCFKGREGKEEGSLGGGERRIRGVYGGREEEEKSWGRKCQGFQHFTTSNHKLNLNIDIAIFITFYSFFFIYWCIFPHF